MQGLGIENVCYQGNNWKRREPDISHDGPGRVRLRAWDGAQWLNCYVEGTITSSLDLHRELSRKSSLERTVPDHEALGTERATEGRAVPAQQSSGTRVRDRDERIGRENLKGGCE